MFGLNWIAGVGVAAAIIGFGSGVWVRDAFCDAAAAKQQVEELKAALADSQGQLKILNTVAAAHSARTVADQSTLDQLAGAVRDLDSKIGAGDCLSATDTRSLRDTLWNRRQPTGTAADPGRHPSLLPRPRRPGAAGRPAQ